MVTARGLGSYDLIRCTIRGAQSLPSTDDSRRSPGGGPTSGPHRRQDATSCQATLRESGTVTTGAAWEFARTMAPTSGADVATLHLGSPCGQHVSSTAATFATGADTAQRHGSGTVARREGGGGKCDPEEKVTFHAILDHALFGPALEVDALRGIYTTSASLQLAPKIAGVGGASNYCMSITHMGPRRSARNQPAPPPPPSSDPGGTSPPPSTRPRCVRRARGGIGTGLQCIQVTTSG